MGKIKKAFVLLSIVGLTFGYSMAAFVVMPEKAEAAKSNNVEITENEVAESEIDSDTNDETTQNDGLGEIQTCEKPSGGNVIDGNGSGYFNTQDQISASWDGFVSDTEITNYKYSVWKKVSGPDIKIVGWTKTNDPDIKSFTATTSDFIIPLVEGGLYYTKVKAQNSCGWSKPAIKSDGQILDITKPQIDSFSLFQNKPYGENVTLSWSANDTGGSGIKSYQIYRNGVPYSSSLDETASSYFDTIFGDNIVYSYYLIAIDKAGNSSLPSNTLFATVDNVAPAPPNISYWIGGKNIVIFWPAVLSASNYEIYRNGALIYSGPDIKYTDTNTVRGEIYSYTVYALDAVGNRSLASNTLEIYVPKPRISTVSTTAEGQVQGETTTQGEQVSPSPSPSGEVKASESTQPEEKSEEAKKTNWSLIIAIIIAAAIVIAGVLYWWYAREEEDEI